MAEVFKGNFTQQEPIAEEAIARAIDVMRTGRLHRYNVVDGERSETSLLEVEYAWYMGAKYCLACASGGYAMHVALKSAGIADDEPVLTNAFTLSPVPGAIDNAGGRPVLVEVTDELVIDFDDLERKIGESESKLLLLSHMRGHLCDMDKLMQILERHNVRLIEDCAHTMGASWNGRKSGTFGLAACFSTQTYKHINSGEGGFITTDDAELMARAIIHSGSYMLYGRHEAAPEPEVFSDIRLDTPNYSGRMDNLRAAILRPQLDRLDKQCEKWNERYQAVEDELRGINGLRVPARPAKEAYVGSSIQFLAERLTPDEIPGFVDACRARGVELKWFGAADPAGYTSRHNSWRYFDHQDMPQTDRVLSRLLDMRIPLTFSVDDCHKIGRIIRDVFETS